MTLLYSLKNNILTNLFIKSRTSLSYIVGIECTWSHLNSMINECTRKMILIRNCVSNYIFKNILYFTYIAISNLFSI